MESRHTLKQEEEPGDQRGVGAQRKSASDGLEVLRAQDPVTLGGPCDLPLQHTGPLPARHQACCAATVVL